MEIGPMRKRYTEEQIIGFLREADAGLSVKDLCRKHGLSEPSYYAWKAKFGGMNVSDAQRLPGAARHRAWPRRKPNARWCCWWTTARRTACC
jgi:transposase-like protein